MKRFYLPTSYYNQNELLESILQELKAKVRKDDPIKNQITLERNSESSYIKTSVAGWVELYIQSIYFLESLPTLNAQIKTLYKEGLKED
jgi:hypothetical protein